MTDVLVVEDENRLRADLVEYLSLRGFAVRGAATAAQYTAAMRERAPDVVVMDVELPDGDGFVLTSELRRDHDCGVVMLTGRGDQEDRIRGFQCGADIYLVKQSPLREIEAAIRSLSRRLRGAARAQEPGVWRLDSKSWRLAAPDGRIIELTAAELAFLSLVMRPGGGPVTRQDLTSAIARPHTVADDRHLDALVSRLRRKIEDHTGEKAPIRASYGVGYAFGANAQID